MFELLFSHRPKSLSPNSHLLLTYFTWNTGGMRTGFPSASNIQSTNLSTWWHILCLPSLEGNIYPLIKGQIFYFVLDSSPLAYSRTSLLEYLLFSVSLFAFYEIFISEYKDAQLFFLFYFYIHFSISISDFNYWSMALLPYIAKLLKNDGCL